MNTARRAIAATQALLIFPALLFMGALIVRQLSLLQHEPAYTAQRIVMWYAGRMWTLWVLLIALPLAVLVTGCVIFLRSRRDLPPGVREGFAAIHGESAMPFVATMTLTAGVVLAIVAMHMLAN